jgi:amino acid transporter
MGGRRVESGSDRVEGAPARSRTLGFWSLLALGVNGIVGVGIFFVPAQVAARVPGMGGVGVYALTAAALAPVAWAYATLGGHFDEDGGPYVWARAAFGARFGFAVGWVAYVSALFSTSAVMAGLAEHAAPSLGLSGPLAERGFIVVCTLLLGSVVASGLKPSAIAWNAVTVLKLLPLLGLAALALAAAAPIAPQAHTGGGVGGVLRAALVVVFAMQGFEIVPVPAGNARASRRAIPLATLGSLAGATVLYLILQWACVRAVPGLSHSGRPLVDAAAVYGGRSAEWLVAAGTNISALGIAFGMFAMSPRYLSTLGRPDGLGEWIGRESERHVPQRALWITLAVVLVLATSGKLGELFVLSSVSVLAQYAVSVAALAVLAVKRKNGLGLRHLWPAPLALGAILLLGQAAKAVELLVFAGVLAAGGLVVLLRRFLARRVTR